MNQSKRQILVGAKAIAARALNDPSRIDTIYDAYARAELPIFKVNGKPHAYEDAIDDAMLKKEQDAIEACQRREKALKERLANRGRQPMALADTSILVEVGNG
jgi:hypothetical protein